jgi:catechol 2,3-dioxygenase
VSLTVANLDRQLEFYQKAIGLTLHWREENSAGLGVGAEDLLRLTEVPGARRYRGTTGMYHFAILLPNKRELAIAIARLFALRYPNSPTDHVMTKTTYLDDLEGNNIEIYTESPEDGYMGFENGGFVARHADGTPSDGREPVDLEKLFAHLTPDDRLDAPLPAGTRIGHYHLYIRNLPESMQFYHEQLGFDNMGVAETFRMGMVSAGQYHHHIGLNTWVGEGAPPAPANSLGMRYMTFVLPDAQAHADFTARLEQVGIPTEQTPEGTALKDPSQNTIVFTHK